MSHPNLEWAQKYMSALEGARITEAGAFEDDGEAWPYFDIVLDAYKLKIRITVSRDEEGNGPGFLFGLPLPK